VLIQAGLLFLSLGNGHFKVFKTKLTFIFRQLFGLLAIQCLMQFFDQMLKPGIGLPEVVNLRLQGFNRHPDIRRKPRQINGFRSFRHARFIQEIRPECRTGNT